MHKKSRKWKNIKKKKTRKYLKNGGNNTSELIFNSHTGGGLFSNFNKLIQCLVNNPTINKIKYNALSGTKGTPLAFIKENEELFTKLFIPYDENKSINTTITSDTCNDDSIAADHASRYYGENRNKLQDYHNVYMKYIGKNIKKNIQNKIDLHIKKLKEDSEQTVGIFIRSKALGSEQPKGVMPSREDYKRVLDSIDTTKKTKYFLCIDNADDLNYYKELYMPNYYTNIRRSTNTNNSEPHKKNIGSLTDLEDSFIEVAVLSSCDILVHSLSNMATASLYMNMNQKSMFVQVE